MDLGLEVKLIWSDDGLYMFQFRATSGGFSGLVELYGQADTIEGLASALDGFPHAVGEQRAIELGSIDPVADTGGIRFSAGCPRAAGPATLRVELRNGWGERMESAEVFLTVEPSAIDEFVRQLRSMELKPGSSARLRGG